MGHENLTDYYKIKSYCKSEGIDVEYLLVSSSRTQRGPARKRRKGLPGSKLMLGLAAVFLTAAVLLASCGVPQSELEKVDYTPSEGTDWQVSTPQEQGINPMLVAQLYYDAQSVETITSLLVIKNGKLIAEGYFHDGSADKLNRMQSATKSITSALAGIAIDQGYIEGVGVKAIDYFPELKDKITDGRKLQITLEQLLMMRAGFPWEESSPELFEVLYGGFYPAMFEEIPLARDPGSDFDYSSLSSHFAGIIVARSVGMSLEEYAQQNLFRPMGIEPGEWITDWEGNNNGHADLHLTARDMAKFGLLYLDGGVFGGKRLVSQGWVDVSLESYSKDAWDYRIGSNYKNIGYGYQWWSADAGKHHFNFAWGHGGQQITLVEDQNMVIVLTADPLFGQHGDDSWKKEKENLNLVADFISTLPAE